MMLRNILLALVCGSSLAQANVTTSSLRAEGAFFKDEQDRVVILRGINVAGNAKVPPFTPLADLTVLEPLKELGFNTMRLLFNWEALEGTEGQYSEAYLQYYENAVKWAAENNFYVVVDFHQDAYSRFSVHGCGEGFPRWTLPPYVNAATPDNGANCKNWALWMIVDKGMHASWTHFYANTYGVRDSYLNMLETVARRLSAYPNVVGYDIINEPWGDEVREVAPFYAAAAARIREQHPQAVMFLNPHVLIGSGMTQSKLPRPAFTNVAYAPHYYDATVVGPQHWFGFKADGVIERMQAKAASWQAPLFLGEFGSPARATRGGEYVDHLYDLLESQFLSGAQWVYTPQWNAKDLDGWNDEDLSILDGEKKLRANHRPRPAFHKVAGLPQDVAHQRSLLGGSVMALTWQHEPSRGTTEIYLPPSHLLAAGDALQYTVTPETAQCERLTERPYVLSCTKAEAGLVTVKMTY